MTKPNRELLLNTDQLHPLGIKLARVDSRLAKRAAEVQAETAKLLPGQVENLPPISSLIYARAHRYRHAGIPPRSHEQILEALPGAIEDIQKQDYAGKKGLTAVVVSRSQEHWDNYMQLADRHQVALIDRAADESHPVAYNQALRRFGYGSGLLSMTEAGGRLATNQAFNAAALATNNETAAIQGTALASAQGSYAEAAFYTAATAHPRFIGHRPREAQAGMGFFAVNRTIVSFDALVEVPGTEDGPFNPTYGNGGYDGNVGERLGTVQMDWAASIIIAESRPLTARQMGQLVFREWTSYGEPNAYAVPLSAQ